MTDRFKEIEENIDMAEDFDMVSGDEQWMRQEIKRLRRIEDTARSLDHCIAEFGDDAPSACSEYFQALGDVLDKNPRP